MMTYKEWDEARVAAKSRLRGLREEIRAHREGNRAYAIQGVADAASKQSSPTDTSTDPETDLIRSIGISKILGRTSGT